MSAKQYPFIDVAVHERVRLPFSRGEAVVLFSKDMARVLWSNGRGAALFGQDNIYDFLDAGPDRTDVAFRQLAATARQVQAPGERRGFLMRIGNGFRSVPVSATVEAVTIRPGDDAILFSAPVASARQSQEEAAAAMLAGFDDPDTHMAVLDGQGAVVAASDGFNSLAIGPETRRVLVEAAGRSAEHLVKRPIATGRGHLPAAIGRISNDPALHLLFAVETILGHLDPDEDNAQPAAETIAGAEPAAELASPLADLPETHAETTVEEQDAAFEQANAEEDAAHDDSTVEEDQPEGPVEDAIGEPVEDVSSGIEEPAEPALEDAASPEALTEETVADETPAASEPAEEKSGFVFNPQGRPIRFVWKIDAEGRFSEISEEFAAAVGPHAAAISGARFGDVAARFDLDPDGKIGDLLGRRDTWSGKTILWPAEGTNLVVPVDLAALPTYSRNREFDGFRGFGIVRIADAAPDPHARGLSLGEAAGEPDVQAALIEETLAKETGTLLESAAEETLETTSETADEALETLDDTSIAAEDEIAQADVAEATDEPTLPEADDTPASRTPSAVSARRCASSKIRPAAIPTRSCSSKPGATVAAFSTVFRRANRRHSARSPASSARPSASASPRTGRLSRPCQKTARPIPKHASTTSRPPKNRSGNPPPARARRRCRGSKSAHMPTIFCMTTMRSAASRPRAGRWIMA